MQASELYEIVKDVPREAWPFPKECFNVYGKQVVLFVSPPLDGREPSRNVDAAVREFVGSMTAWLSRKPDGSKRTIIISGNLVGWPESDRELSSGVWTWYGVGDSLVAALAAACREVGDDGSK